MVEDSEDDVLLTIRALKKGGYDPVYERVEDAAAMRKALREKTWDVILCDYQMPQFNGLAAISLLTETSMDIPFIIVSGTIGEELAAECMRLGAHDYIIKSNLSRLVPAIERELKESESRIQLKQVEDVLRESEEKYRTLFENSVVGISQALPDGHLITVNNAYAKMYGYANAEEMMVESSDLGQRYVNQEDQNEVLRILTEKGVMVPREMDVVHRDGTRFTVLVGARKIRDSKGNMQRYQAEHIDITERKQAESALKESENRYRLLADNVDDVIFVLDLNLNYTYVSPSIKILRGYEPAEVLKQTPIETLTPSSRNLAMSTLSEIMEIEKSDHRDKNISRMLQLEMFRKDGTTVWTEVKFSFIRDEDQRVLGILGVTRDITERKEAEENLKKRNEEIREMTHQLWQVAKLATMGELAASIAHELNNPLAIVSLRVESLIEKTPEDNSNHRELNIIAHEVERMGNLVANLLLFSRRSQQQISTIDVREEIEKTLELIYYHLRKHNIIIGREFAKDIPHIHADHQQLRQLLLNLFTNASDAMPQGGTLTIRVIELPESRQLVIEVTDTGMGIPPDILPKVMEPFYTTKQEGRGTGLGLAICRRIVQEYKGTFDLTSEGIPGRGTTARISLPVTSGNNTAGLKDKAQKPGGWELRNR